MPKDTKTLGNNKARACESLGFVHKKRLCQRFDTTSLSLSIKTIRITHSIRHNEKVAIFYTAIYIGSSKKDTIEQKPDLVLIVFSKTM